MEFIVSYIFSLIWCAVGAGLCYKIAENNNRNPIIATALGVLFGIFAVIGYLIVGKPKLKE